MSEETIALITMYALRGIGALVGLWAAITLSRWAGRAVTKQLSRSGRLDETISRFAGKAVRAVLLVLALLAVLSLVGIPTASFVAVIGAAGLAIGLAMEGTLSNFAAGLMLLVFRPFNVGDVINAAGVTGKVDEIGIFTTTVDTPDNRRLVVPNGAVFGSTIENATYHDRRRVDVSLGVAYSADLDATRAVLEAVATANPKVLTEPAPVVVLTGLGDSSVNWVIRAWVLTPDYWAVLEELLRAVKYALDDAGIGIPYPTMDVNLVGAAKAAA
jgi:small conductance mechanosensitive channel